MWLKSSGNRAVPKSTQAVCGTPRYHPRLRSKLSYTLIPILRSIEFPKQKQSFLVGNLTLPFALQSTDQRDRSWKAEEERDGHAKSRVELLVSSPRSKSVLASRGQIAAQTKGKQGKK